MLCGISSFCAPYHPRAGSTESPKPVHGASIPLHSLTLKASCRLHVRLGPYPPGGRLLWIKRIPLLSINATPLLESFALQENLLLEFLLICHLEFIIRGFLISRYPFHPPKVRFLTKIYHPNIDSAGRICLDILKLPPSGGWRPAHNLSSILTSIRLLMASPNPNDPLMTDIAEEYQFKKSQYEATAKEWTAKFAKSVEDTAKPGQEESKSSEKRSNESDEENEETSKKAKK
ncbi:ubiquitin-conjugating enzyme E2 T-like [Penaeus indicus]|uniref:ubiquitin-conjugating enzyme E2 T-like n=1 Tax=Penaeus indicus TaxID=29960 RepID=UPI00300D310C